MVVPALPLFVEHLWIVQEKVHLLLAVGITDHRGIRPIQLKHPLLGTV